LSRLDTLVDRFRFAEAALPGLAAHNGLAGCLRIEKVARSASERELVLLDASGEELARCPLTLSGQPTTAACFEYLAGRIEMLSAAVQPLAPDGPPLVAA
jgi:hypothetical protein